MLMLNTLKDLLKMVEQSPQYRQGPHWAVAAVVDLRQHIADFEEREAAYKAAQAAFLR